jgi:hypothetical protein
VHASDPRGVPRGLARNAGRATLWAAVGLVLARGVGDMIAAIRVTTVQASVLQGFRPDYSWKRSRSAQFRQIGDAVCPLLAAKALAAAMALTGTRRAPDARRARFAPWCAPWAARRFAPRCAPRSARRSPMGCAIAMTAGDPGAGGSLTNIREAEVTSRET